MRRADIYCGSRIWDTASGQCLKTLIGSPLALSSQLTRCRRGQPARLRRAVHAQRQVRAAGHAGQACCGLPLCTAVMGRSTIRLWNCVTGKVVKAYTGHKNEQYCCAPAIIAAPGTQACRSTPHTHQC